MISLPIEVQLDIFKYLNYEELYSVKQTNLYFREFIDKYEEEFAREKYDEICIEYLNQYKDDPYKLIKPEFENFDFPLNERLEEKLENGLEKPIHLYLSDEESDNEELIISLKKVYVDKYHLVILQLPTIIENKEDFKIVYYYLNKLFNCYFDIGDFHTFLFNPELIELLFGRIPKQFYIRSSCINIWYNTENCLNSILNHLIITESLIIDFWDLEDDTEYADNLFKILTSGNNFNEVNLRFNALQKLFELVLTFIETSNECSKMVANIELNNLNIPFTGLNGRAEKIEEHLSEGYLATKYQLSNKFNPNIKFSILCKRNIVEIKRN